MNRIQILALIALAGIAAAGCKENTESAGTNAGGTHTHADGTVHSDEADQAVEEAVEEAAAEGEDHAHAETALGSVTMGDMIVELAQGHGVVAAGKESHLVVKLPYSDGGATAVRAWIGTEDRTLSMVGKGEYAASHDDYDLHAVAPDPLPEGTMWWVEIEKPDGTKVVGSVKPIVE